MEVCRRYMNFLDSMRVLDEDGKEFEVWVCIRSGNLYVGVPVEKYLYNPLHHQAQEPLRNLMEKLGFKESNTGLLISEKKEEENEEKKGCMATGYFLPYERQSLIGNISYVIDILSSVKAA